MRNVTKLKQLQHIFYRRKWFGSYRSIGSTTFDSNQNFINGKRCGSAERKNEYVNINPANGGEIGNFYLSSDVDVNEAVQSAKDAFESWSRSTASERSKILRKAADIVEANKGDIAKLETLDTGMILMIMSLFLLVLMPLQFSLKNVLRNVLFCFGILR